jgi:hypothetical protein
MLTDTGIARNRATTEQLLKAEAAWCERQAFLLRQDAARLIEQAAIYEAEARHFRAQLREAA